MKGSIAKAARVFDALRIKLEAGSPSTPSAPAAPVAEAVAVVEEASPVEEAASPEPVIENNKEEA
jgi:large subunit ribosomal protein L10